MQPCIKRKFEKRFGKALKTEDNVRGNDMNNFVQPCTTLELVKYVYFDLSVPNQTHLCHLCLASVPSVLSVPICAHLRPSVPLRLTLSK